MKLLKLLLTFISFLFFIPFAFMFRLTQAFYTDSERTMSLFDIRADDNSMIRRKARDHENFIANLEAAEEASRLKLEAEAEEKRKELKEKEEAEAKKKKEAARKRKAREAAKKKAAPKKAAPKKTAPKKVELEVTTNEAEGDDF